MPPEFERNIYLEDIPLDEARAHLLTLAANHQLAIEIVPLHQAHGRVTSTTVWASLSAPHYHASAMDGYAVRAQDTLYATETRPIELRLGEQAFPVNTGDPLPPTTNAVIMIEVVEMIDEHTLQIRASVAPRQHVRLMGEDMVATELVLPANHLLRPVDLGALAGSGHHQVEVWHKPHVVIMPTGSELVPATQTPQAGEIIEFNSLMLSAQVSEIGGTVTVTEIVPDEPTAIENILAEIIAQKPDVILVLSGSSAGSRDYTAHVLQQMGQLVVHGVAVRPGHPVIIGAIRDIPVLGIPGYPVSAALTGELFVQPLLAYWLGTASPLETRPRVQATMTRKLVSPTGDDDFVRVGLAQVGERLLATPLQRGAGVISSMVRADGLAHIPRFSEGVDMGQAVEVMLYRPQHAIQQAILAMGSHDPLLDLLAQFLTQAYPERRLSSANVGSMGGLIALKRGEAHLAGVHLLDPATGEYNLTYIGNQLPERTVTVVTFAHREQGFIVVKGNPQGVEDITDLGRTRFVNRQRGSGTRLLVDYEISQNDITKGDIIGYDHEEVTHLAVASAVKSGIADCGVGVRRAAIALDLDFISLGWERYDLVIPNEHLAHVEPLLDVLRSVEFKQALGEQAGYSADETGQVVMT